MKNIQFLRIVSGKATIDECLGFISDQKPNSLWFNALNMGEQYITEADEWVYQIRLDDLISITFEEVKSISRLFYDALFIADGIRIQGGMPVFRTGWGYAPSPQTSSVLIKRKVTL